MRAEVKAFHSPDLDWGREYPDDPQNFGVLLQVFVGPKGLPGSESFNIIVCSPAFLQVQVKELGIIDGRHHLILSEFDPVKIESYIRRRVSSLEGEDWESLAGKVGRLGRWEYEDYEE